MSETRRPLISANWKMNLNHFEAIKIIQELSYAISKEDIDEVDISIHVPFTDIRSVQTVLEADKIPFFLGAQNAHQETSGAFTGEISPAMLAKLNVQYVIVGHSERRQIYGETNELVNQKIQAVLKNEMKAILCVGETLEQRQEQKHFEIVEHQIKESLSKIKKSELENIVLAYEPIWAIGTGETASAADAQEMCQHVRTVISSLYDQQAADETIIQYGGSVKPANAASLLSQQDIDGALVGGASLDVADFSKIVQYRLQLLSEVL